MRVDGTWRHTVEAKHTIDRIQGLGGDTLMFVMSTVIFQKRAAQTCGRAKYDGGEGEAPCGTRRPHWTHRIIFPVFCSPLNCSISSLSKKARGIVATTVNLLSWLENSGDQNEDMRNQRNGVFMLRPEALLCLAGILAAPVVGSAEVSLSQVTGILARECVMCHQPYDAKGELTLHPSGAWKNLVEVSSTQVDMFLVTPGDLDQSYLYRKLTDTHLEAGGSGDAMPFDAKLTAEQLATIRVWIEQGAQNDEKSH
jgi:hypothetical protein